MNQLAVVTVLYRSRAMLAKTLPTWVRSADGLAVEFVFVDNSPDDGCRDVIADCFQQTGSYRYLPDATNSGFAAGCNRGVEAVTAPHVLLLNPDVHLSDDSFASLLAAVATAPDRPLAVGLAMHGREYTGIDVHPVSLFIDRPTGLRRGPLGPSGGAAILPVDLWRRYGGFVEPLFAWGEDADLAFRLYASGVRTGTVDLALPHAWGHSVEGEPKLHGFRAFLLARNRVLVAARNLSWPLLLVALPLLILAHLALGVRRARQGLLRPFLRGVGHGLRGAPAARRQRLSSRCPRFGLAHLRAYLRGGTAG
jgi:GT2 family glycosyltransferase